MAGVKKSAPPYAKRRWGALLVPRAGVEPARSPLHRWVSVVPPLSPSFPTHLKGVQDRTPIVAD